MSWGMDNGRGGVCDHFFTDEGSQGASDALMGEIRRLGKVAWFVTLAVVPVGF